LNVIVRRAASCAIDCTGSCGTAVASPACRRRCRRSTVATSLAVWMGSRCTTRQTRVPSLMVLVTTVAAPVATNGSWVSGRSTVPVSPLIPAFRRHRSSALPGPPGRKRSHPDGSRDRDRRAGGAGAACSTRTARCSFTLLRCFGHRGNGHSVGIGANSCEHLAEVVNRSVLEGLQLPLVTGCYRHCVQSWICYTGGA
jgi:hypothetical protein